jgi:hypothetical protein
VTEDDAPARQVVRRNRNSHSVSKHHADAVTTELARQVGVHISARFSFDEEVATGKNFLHDTFDFNQIVSSQSTLKYVRIRTDGPISSSLRFGQLDHRTYMALNSHSAGRQALLSALVQRWLRSVMEGERPRARSNISLTNDFLTDEFFEPGSGTERAKSMQSAINVKVHRCLRAFRPTGRSHPSR